MRTVVAAFDVTPHPENVERRLIVFASDGTTWNVRCASDGGSYWTQRLPPDNPTRSNVFTNMPQP